MKIFTSAQIHELDKYTIEHEPIKSIDLMERAATALTQAILTAFGVQHQAILDLVSGAAEPSGLLPMQLPEDMRTVEEQCEDVPHDMRCYQDADGHRYDFAFGLDWNGVIDDARTRKYRKN